MTRAEVADWMASLRKAAGMSQEDMAAKLGVTQSAVSTWERGRREPGVDTIAQWLHACGYSLHMQATGRTSDTLGVAIPTYLAPLLDAAGRLDETDIALLTRTARLLLRLPDPVRQHLVDEIELWEQRYRDAQLRVIKGD